VRLRDIAAVAETHLDDLQADMEAGSRHLQRIRTEGEQLRDSLFETQIEQAALMGSLLKRIRDLKESLQQQRLTMRDLRRDIGELRKLSANARQS
jgi:SMC interacting uncharacterized protein involved in chromosome segregation